MPPSSLRLTPHLGFRALPQSVTIDAEEVWHELRLCMCLLAPGRAVEAEEHILAALKLRHTDTCEHLECLGSVLAEPLNPGIASAGPICWGVDWISTRRSGLSTKTQPQLNSASLPGAASESRTHLLSLSRPRGFLVVCGVLVVGGLLALGLRGKEPGREEEKPVTNAAPLWAPLRDLPDAEEDAVDAELSTYTDRTRLITV